ncbi:hypothetical protein [Aliiroseovarius crassostreae]|nr:hypothetical protein [Aliiroseovarius crassostreae]
MIDFSLWDAGVAGADVGDAAEIQQGADQPVVTGGWGRSWRVGSVIDR